MSWLASLAGTSFDKRAPLDASARLQLALASADRRWRRAFMATVKGISNTWTLDYLSNLIERGQFEEALQTARLNASNLANANSQTYILAGQANALTATAELGLHLGFDAVNQRAVNQMQAASLRLIVGFTDDQRDALRVALTTGVREGLNPREVARTARSMIGLTGRQAEAVSNYRSLLTLNSSEALARELRDRRFDTTVRSAINTGNVLAKDQIDRMVDRYAARYVAYRAETIARTEALRSVHEGAYEMLQQVVDAGKADDEDLIRSWVTAHDDRVRDSHAEMDGQEVSGLDEPFISGLGNELMYPGDPDAPAEDVIQCRCVVTTRIRKPSEK